MIIIKYILNPDKYKKVPSAYINCYTVSVKLHNTKTILKVYKEYYLSNAPPFMNCYIVSVKLHTVIQRQFLKYTWTII